MGGCERLARFYREQWAGGGHYLAYCALGNYQDASPILKQEPNQTTFAASVAIVDLPVVTGAELLEGQARPQTSVLTYRNLPSGVRNRLLFTPRNHPICPPFRETPPEI
jgi:hypothetical protein